MVSVIIPAYNAEKTIERCIYSIFQGEVENDSVECIIINDGSTDATANKLIELKKIFPNVIVINTDNGGVSHARNVGIEYAHGEWVLFLDADDELSENWTEKVIDDRFSSTDIVIFEYVNIVPPNSEFVTHYSLPENFTEKDIDRIVLTTPEWNTCWGKLIKRQLIENNNLRFLENIKYGEDAIFIQQSCMSAKEIQVCRKPIIKYYYNTSSAMRNGKIEKRLQDGIALLNNRLKYAEKKNELEFIDEIYNHHFKTITAIMLDISKSHGNKRDDYRLLRQHPYTKTVLQHVSFKKLKLLKKFEYLLICKVYCPSIIYFRLKGLFRKENSF